MWAGKACIDRKAGFIDGNFIFKENLSRKKDIVPAIVEVLE